MLTYSQCFFESTIGDLLSNNQKTGLLNRKLEYFNDELWFDFFEFFQIFW